MLLALTCALCAVQPLPATPASSLLEPQSYLQVTGPTAPASPLHLAMPAALAVPLTSSAPLALASLPLQDAGSGDGDHSGHMSPMWIVMGAVMVVMMVGAGAYYMGHGTSVARPLSPTTLASPAMVAIPVVSRGGG